MIEIAKRICYLDTYDNIHLQNNEFYKHFDVENVINKHFVIRGILDILNVFICKHADTV